MAQPRGAWGDAAELIHNSTQDYMEAFSRHGNGEGICGGGEGGSGGMSLRCELLLRVLAEFWLEGNTVLRPGWHPERGRAAAAAAAAARLRQHRHQQHQQPPEQRAAIALLWSDFTAPTDASLHGLLVASTHLLADPRLRETCRRHLGLEAPATTGTRGAAIAGGSSSVVVVAGGGGALTPALKVLRPHVFGFLRVAFSPESTMHTSSAAFSLAVELWMLWMRPWAAPAISRGGAPDSTKLNQPLGAVTAARVSTQRGVSSASSSSAAASARRAGDETGGVDAMVNRVASAVKHLFRIEPCGASASSGDREGPGWGEETAVASPARTRQGAGPLFSVMTLVVAGCWRTAACMYTTLLAAFVRKAGNMSFKVNAGREIAVEDKGVGSTGHVFAITGGANLRLLHRVTEVFSPGVVWLLASAQGPDLVTLDKYDRDVAEELLITIWDLAHPRVARDWMTKLEKLVCDPGSNKSTERACKVYTKIKTLFGLPSDWKPKGNGGEGAASGAVKAANMFHPDREKHPPIFLSRQGKTLLVSGRRTCRGPHVPPAEGMGDGLLISFWVGVSESVNDKWLGWTSLTLGLVLALILLWLTCLVSLSFGAFFATLLGALALRGSTMD